MAINQYFGKYRAKVVDSSDPEERGRIRVMCPKVLGEAKSSWCEPCIPVAYDGGGDFAIPKVGEFVWVEFEEGNANKPLYTGGLWSKKSSPSNPYTVAERFIIWGKCKIHVSKDDVMTLSVGKKCSIVMKEDKTTISVGNSSITLTESNVKISSAKIDLNP